MGERDLARARYRAAADQAGGRDRVVRRPEWPPGGEPAVAQARDALDPRDLEGLLEARRRQDAGHAAREHRLADPRRSDHQDVVTAGGRYLERPASVILTADVGQVRTVAGIGGTGGGLGRIRVPVSADEVDQLRERRNTEHVDVGHQRGLARVLGGDDEPPVARAACARCDGDRSVDRAQGAAERQLAAYRVVAETVGGDLAGGCQHRHRYREVEARTRLAEVRGREVRGEPLLREVEPRVEQCRPDALPGLADRAVRKPHDREPWEPAAQVDLDRYLAAVDPDDRECGDA